MRVEYKRGLRGGFTLIELLVVIAIIGLLASIILVSLNSARSSGKDARIIGDIAQIRTLVETDATSGGDYSASFAAANTLVNTGNYGTLVADITTQGGAFNVVTNAVAPFITYALYGQLTGPTTPTYYCKDNTGTVNSAAIDNTGVACP